MNTSHNLSDEELNDFARKEISFFLSDYPLYTKFQLQTIYMLSDIDFIGASFKFFCKNDNDYTTYKLGAKNNDLLVKAGRLRQTLSSVASNSSYDINFTEHYVGTCQSCNRNIVNMLINVFTTKNESSFPDIFLRKVGQFPAPSIKPEKDINDFLTEIDKEYYKKALQNLEYGYGIGAYAYFRRIVENEIHNIAELIYQKTNSAEIQTAISEYKSSHRMANLISALYKHLPTRITTDLGNNLLLKMHEQLSDGIHNLSEEECVQKAKDMDKMLTFLIREIRKEDEVSSVKDILRRL